MKYTSIIFDMDGTIIRTEHLWEQANIELLANRGITLSVTEFTELKQKLHGLAIHKSCELIKHSFGLPDPVEALIQEKGARAHSLYSDGIHFIDGFTEFHSLTRSLGLTSAIGTNADQNIVNIANKKLNLEQFFGSHLYNMDHVNNCHKPNPAVFLYAAQKLDADPARCIVIEDSPPGITAAKKAGMYCIAINTSKKRENLSEADLIVEGYHELDRLLLEKKLIS